MQQVGLKAVPENVRKVVGSIAADSIVRPYPQWYRPKYTPNDLTDRLAVLWTGEKKAADLLPALEKEFNDVLSKPLS
jgi:predicted metal-dependent hydrolase